LPLETFLGRFGLRFGRGGQLALLGFGFVLELLK